MVNRANEWLRRNGHLKANTCESIEVKGRMDGVVDTNKSSYFEADHVKRRMRNMYIRALRYVRNMYIRALSYVRNMYIRALRYMRSVYLYDHNTDRSFKRKTYMREYMYRSSIN